MSKIKTDVKKYNDDQHEFMKAIKAVGQDARKISPDTKAKDFATIAEDAEQLQALNDLESS